MSPTSSATRRSDPRVVTVEAQVTALSGAVHGEGPIWSPQLGGLLWLDMLRGCILGADDLGRVRRSPVGPVAALVRPTADGAAIVATADSFLFLDRSLTTVTAEVPCFDDAAVRFNEGTVAPDGSLLCGTMAYDQSPGSGAIYRLGLDGDVRQMTSGLGIANGMAFGASGPWGYFVDSLTSRIDKIRYDPTDGLVERSAFVILPEELGMPDGICLDDDGGVWVALFGGGAVHRYDAAGRLTTIVQVPVHQVTSCAFGDADLSTLYITTSSHGTTGPTGQAGAVFRACVDHRGLPLRAFGAQR